MFKKKEEEEGKEEGEEDAGEAQEEGEATKCSLSGITPRSLFTVSPP